MVSKATNMVLGSGKKKRPCNQVKDSHGKTILAQNIWFSLSFFLRRQIWFWPVQCWFIHRSVLFCHLENTAIPLAKEIFFRMDVFSTFITIQNIFNNMFWSKMQCVHLYNGPSFKYSNNMFWSKMRCVHLHNGASFSACIFSNISLVQVF